MINPALLIFPQWGLGRKKAEETLEIFGKMLVDPLRWSPYGPAPWEPIAQR
jgi:hypothetical protein